MRLPDVLFVSGHVHAERAGDFSRAVAGAVVNDVHIRGQKASLQNAAQRSCRCPPPRPSRATLRKAFSQLTFHNQLAGIESHRVNSVFATAQFMSCLIKTRVV